MRPQLYGASYSVYLRIARLTLLEKGVDVDHREVDIFAEGGPPADYVRLQPFGRIPAFVHGDFTLYETGAITRYIDEAFSGPALQPTDPKARARMNQIISLADSYLYRPLVWGIYVARDDAAKTNAPIDQAALDEAVARSRQSLTALADLCGDGPRLLGETLSLADLHLAPMVAYGSVADVGRTLLREQPCLSAWWGHMNARPSMTATRFAAET
jgi:glutathione S-transferase